MFLFNVSFYIFASLISLFVSKNACFFVKYVTYSNNIYYLIIKDEQHFPQKTHFRADFLHLIQIFLKPFYHHTIWFLFTILL